MKQTGYALAAVCAAAVGTWALASACPNHSSTLVTANGYTKKNTVTVYDAAHPDGVLLAANTCPASACPHATSATTAAAAKCPYSGSATTAATAAKATPAMTAAATTAPAGMVAAVPAASTCGGSAATAASSGSCSGKTTAAAAGHDGCSGKNAATAGSACGSHSVGSTAAMGTGACGGQGMTLGINGAMNLDCDACADMETCRQELDQKGASVQMVPLKNGLMYVYTADTPAHVRAVQATLARRDQHVNTLMAAGDKAKLCPDCKTMRGAIASGTLTREVVKVESGCLVLLTSSDPTMVLKLHDLSGAKALAHKM
jgi:hypothetical protein